MNRRKPQHLVKWACALALSGAAALVATAVTRQPPVVSDLVSRVPAAKDALKFNGAGFKVARGHAYQSDRAAVSGRSLSQTVVVSAPQRATGTFELQDADGGKRANVRLTGASKTPTAELESGIVTYRDVFPDVDVVAVRDAERFELGYVAHSRELPPLELDVAAEGATLRLEPTTGAAILQREAGAPKLRIAPPIAFDAAGQRRDGHYELADADTLRIALDVHDLQPPIFIDPAFFIPYWSLVEDARAPGGAAYDTKQQSRQSQIVMNGATGRPWLIRRAAPLSTYFFEAVGAEHPEEEYNSFSDKPRIANATAPSPPNPLLNQDFERTADVESETFEWTDNGWQLLPQVGLPGFVDPTVAYDSAHSKMFAFGGRLHGPNARDVATNASVVFQNDGSGWVAKGHPGAPAARERAASAALGGKVVVFGGRSLLAPQDLLNDTWTFDQSGWKKLQISNPPPACESSQLVYDKRRERLVLVGGNCAVSLAYQPSDNDGFRLWEFDGTDWIRRFDIVDPSLPRSFQLRRGVAAAWHPQRQTTLLFGGFVDVTERCPLSPADVVTQRDKAKIDFAVRNDSTLWIQLENQGCWGGYAHDTWEWDGTTLRQLTATAAAADRNPARGAVGTVFRQVAGTIVGPSVGSDSVVGSTNTKLWPWRYDSSTRHFAQRSALERTSDAAGVPNAPATVRAATNALSANPGAAQTLVSPSFRPAARPQLVTLPNGNLLIFFSDDGQVYETDLTTWTDRTPKKTPFASGQADFFAAAFDTARQRTVLFDPVDGTTWEHDAQGWHRISTATSPGPWTGTWPTWVRNLQELVTLNVGYSVRPPTMAFDRARNRAMMLHRNLLWEYDGKNWTQFTPPAALQNCALATLMAFNGVSNKTVVVGCSLPAKTWEWDGSAWTGPFASPYKDMVSRGFVRNLIGTVEREYAHPNALFESAALGGVGVVDGGGTLRVWKDGVWQAGPNAGDPLITQASNNYNTNKGSFTQLAVALLPPIIEDYGANRLLMFGAGIRATRELKLLPQPATAWTDTFLGTSVGGGIGGYGITSVNPFPQELLPFEFVPSLAWADPSTMTDRLGNPKTGDNGSSGAWTNVAWSLRFLPDPVAKQVHVLTDRGVFWELGSEHINNVGEACTTSADCKDSVPCQQGVCCEQACDGVCLTCNGAHPGKCEAAPAGTPEAKNRCGTGECAGVCAGEYHESNGNPHSSCTFPPGRACGTGTTCNNGQLTGAGQCSTSASTCVAPPTPDTTVACNGGLGCANATSCKTACTASSDCQSPYDLCAPDGSRCVSDGKVCHNDGQCPKFNKCAADGMSCAPDAVLAAATARGVSPVSWDRPRARTAAEIAAALKAAGYRQDEIGRVHFDDYALAGVEAVFDPSYSSPSTGLRSCGYQLEACYVATKDLDGCVAASSRCQTATPWSNDPAGSDCCPEACLLRYFDERDKNQTSLRSLRTVLASDCYPGLREYLKELR